MYEEIRILGKGGFGTVKLYRHKITNRNVAIKFLSFASLQNSQDVGRIYREVQVLRNQ
jgi:serine/threonine protein kinase